MSLLSRFFYKRPPDGLLEFVERVYVFDSCFSTEVLPEGMYQIYLHEIVTELHEEFPESSFLAFNFREGEKRSQFAEILCEYDVTVMDYPRQYEGCPLLPLSLIQHFLRVCESWLFLGKQQNVILLHCERGGWPLLAFLLASFLIFRKLHSGERKTLDIVHREAPKGFLQLLSPLNPLPSQLRYLQYVARRNIAPEWPPPERALSLDCVILRAIPNFDSQNGCTPIIRIFGRNYLSKGGLSTHMLFSMPRKKTLRTYRQADCDVIKIDIQCLVQGDVVLECVHLDSDPEREVMMFRVMFNTAFIRSNILMLNSENLDILWDSKECYPKGFRAEVLFGEVESISPPRAPTTILNGEEKGGLPIEAFSRVQELFNGGEWVDRNDDAALWLLKQLSVLSDTKEMSRLQNRVSLFTSPADSEEENNASSTADKIDISELESLFSAASASDRNGSKAGGRRGPTMTKLEKVQLVDLRRAYNCEIMLSKIKIPLPDMINAVMALDSSVLDIDQVENLIRFCPTKEEMETLKNYTGEKEMLGKCEQFFLELMKVPRVEPKLRVFAFKITFSSQVKDLRSNLITINSATKEVKESAKLRQVMQTILTLGNALNQGTARGSAIGFKLDSLLKLSDTRARNNKMTLMHYLCKLIAEKMPELLDFDKDLIHLEAASKIPLKALAEEMQAVSKGLEKVEQELAAAENDGVISSGFRKVLKNFLDTAEAEVRSLISLYSEVGRNADSLSQYFGEDPSRCPFEQVTQVLFVFVKMFSKSREENERLADIEKKKLEKEAMKERTELLCISRSILH
ncbi:hypothetical protein ACLB2K_050221 [Fragaria x ananassa]